MPDIQSAASCCKAIGNKISCRIRPPEAFWHRYFALRSTFTLRLFSSVFILATMLIFSQAGADNHNAREPGHGFGDGLTHSGLNPDGDTPRLLANTSGSRLLAFNDLSDPAQVVDEDFKEPETDVNASATDAERLPAESHDSPQPGSGCITQPPLLSISPSSQGARAGAEIDYIISVTNQDYTGCAPSIFTLDSGTPPGWLKSLSTSILALEPGETGSATLSLTSPESAPYGSYSIVANVADTAEPAHSARARASYNVTEDCAPAPASLDILPGTQRGAPGSRLTYTVSLTNNDSAACYPSTFYMAITFLPVGWSGNVSPRILSLSPGITVAATLLVTSADTAVAGSNKFQVAVSDDSEPMHTHTTVASYIVRDTAKPHDTR